MAGRYSGLLAGCTNPQHLEQFGRQRKRHCRGGALAPSCGAMTKAGKLCDRAPIADGNGRCILHCGQTVARQYRRRQFDEFRTGEISAAQWRAAETKRALNRLREIWKKAPWRTGRTIDLGPHEDGFAAELINHGVKLNALPPSISDWLRWRYLRLQVETHSGVRWKKVLDLELPIRLKRAGPTPAGFDPTRALGFEPVESLDPELPFGHGLLGGIGPDDLVHKALSAVDTRSKRAAPDRPTPPPRAPERKRLSIRGARRRDNILQTASEDEQNRLALIHSDNLPTLQALYAKCQDEAERRVVFRALVNMVDRPDDQAAQKRWTTVVMRLHCPPDSAGRRLKQDTWYAERVR